MILEIIGESWSLYGDMINALFCFTWGNSSSWGTGLDSLIWPSVLYLKGQSSFRWSRKALIFCRLALNDCTVYSVCISISRFVPWESVSCYLASNYYSIFPQNLTGSSQASSKSVSGFFRALGLVRLLCWTSCSSEMDRGEPWLADR